MKPEVKTLKIDSLTADDGIQPRAKGLDAATVDEYAEAMQADPTAFPPVVVYRDSDGNHWLSQGFHRLAAAFKAGLEVIQAEIRIGGRKEAILDAAGSNAIHGLKRTNADKRRAVELVLAEYPSWSNRKLAEACGVSDEFVRSVRPQVPTVGSSSSSEDKKQGRDGKWRGPKHTAPAAPKHQEEQAEDTPEPPPQEAPEPDAGADEPHVVPQEPEVQPDPCAEFVGRINRVCKALDDLRKSVNEIAAEPTFGKHVHGESVTYQIEAARKALWQSRPTEPCNCVRKDKPAATCKACFGTGVCPASRVLKGGR